MPNRLRGTNFCITENQKLLVSGIWRFGRQFDYPQEEYTVLTAFIAWKRSLAQYAARSQLVKADDNSRLCLLLPRYAPAHVQ